MNEKAVQEYMVKLSENQAKLHKILSYMIGKSYVDVGEINYTHLGDLGYVSDKLDDVINFLNIKE